MFENAQWIALEYADYFSPFRGKPFENEDVPSWEGDPAYEHTEYGSVVFRKTFTAEETPARALLRISGLGYYEVWINGQKPDEDRVLAPTVSDYYRYYRYNTYDVTPLLKQGKNLIAVEVCGGWFSGRKNYWGWQQIFYGNPRLCASLSLQNNDGGTETVVTDTKTWKVRRGTVIRSCIYDGEITDLNALPKNWMTADYDDGAWGLPQKAIAPCDVPVPDDFPPVRLCAPTAPAATWDLSDTDTVYDFGKNGTAVPQLTVRGKKGDTVTLHYAEFIHADGTLNEVSCQGGGAVNTDVFTLTGENDELRPRFTWHGFRYCRLTRSDKEIVVLSATKRELHSDVERTGAFACSDGKLNRLHEAYANTQLSCLVGGPLDCAQRGERKGWTGDAGVSCEEAVYNFDMAALYRAFLDDMVRERHPERKTFGVICPNHKSGFDGTCIDWAIAFPIIIYETYARTGDVSVLENNWQPLCDWLTYYTDLREESGLLPVRYVDKYSGKTTSPAWFGDWYTVDHTPGTERVAFDCGGRDHRQNPEFLGSVFYVWALRLAAQIARVLGKTDTADEYLASREETKKALLGNYYDGKKHELGAGGQFLQTFALFEHLVPDEERDAVFENLLSVLETQGYHSPVGIFGQRMIGDVLREFGREDVLYRLLTTEGYPGFYHMIEEGQTTIAENLTGGNNDVWGSGAHCMFAAADASLHRIFGGITVNRFRAVPITLAPFLAEGLSFAEDRQKLAEGEVFCRWERQGCDVLLTFDVPAGLSADVRLRAGTAVFRDTVQAGRRTLRFDAAKNVFIYE